MTGGGTNFQAPSYSPQTGWMYVAYHDGGGRYASGPASYEPGRQFWGRGTGGGPPATTPENSHGLAAIDPETGKIQWRYLLTQNSLSSGALATAGGVLVPGIATG